MSTHRGTHNYDRFIMSQIAFMTDRVGDARCVRRNTEKDSLPGAANAAWSDSSHAKSS